MKINKSSWHYQVAEFGLKNSRPSNSLCLYFWQVVYSLFMILVSGIVIAALAGAVLSPILMFFIDDIAELGIAVAIVEIAILSWYLLTKVKEKVEDVSFVRVAVNYLAAKKKRICPQLEFE